MFNILQGRHKISYCSFTDRNKNAAKVCLMLQSVVAEYDCELLYLQPCAFFKNYLTTRLS